MDYEIKCRYSNGGTGFIILQKSLCREPAKGADRLFMEICHCHLPLPCQVYALNKGKSMKECRKHEKPYIRSVIPFLAALQSLHYDFRSTVALVTSSCTFGC